MSPASALQSRIRQFEALDATVSPKPPVDRYPTPPVRKPVPYHPYSKSPNPLDDPISPTSSMIRSLKPVANVPYVPRKQRSASPSPPNLGLKSSLIDLRDWMTEDEFPSGARRDSQKFASPQPPGQNGFGAKALKPTANFGSAKPPLPPRKLSGNTEAAGLTMLRAPALSTRSTSDTLTPDHTYPPSSSLSARGQGHKNASSTSSFHSVSLSSDAGTDGGKSDSISNFVATFPIDREDADRDKDIDYIDDSFSFETVSSSALSSPTIVSARDFDPNQQSAPPKLPDRPPSTPIKTNKPLSTSRRVPPPPPPFIRSRPPSDRSSFASTTTTASDRSSIFSTNTVTTSNTSISNHTQAPSSSRPIPVPYIARRRYEKLFTLNVAAQHRVAQSLLSPDAGALTPASSGKLGASLSPRKGWRGLSVDLIGQTGEPPILNTPDKEEGSAVDGGDARLDGQIVKLIWSKSRLEKSKLRDIWNECASRGDGTLNRDMFVKGMWLIDEELRRAHNEFSKAARRRNPPARRTTTIR